MSTIDKHLSSLFNVTSQHMNIATRLNAVREKIARTCSECKRDPHHVTLVAVSKLQNISDIKLAYEAGQRVFGENYVQELRDKAAQLPQDIAWHLIGKLQRRNVKHLPANCTFLETLDSMELAEALEKRSTTPLSCLVQVNIGKELSKGGVAPEQLLPFLTQLTHFQKMHVVGLMCIPPFDDDAEKSRPHFQQLRSLLEQANRAKIFAHPLTELSMGMSHDFPIAIEEGATIIRVGSAIFPARQ